MTAKKKSRTTARARSGKTKRKTAASAKKAATRRSNSKAQRQATTKRRKTTAAKISASSKRSARVGGRSAKTSKTSSRRASGRGKVASATRTPRLGKTTSDVSPKRMRGERRDADRVRTKKRPRSAPSPTSHDPVPFPEEQRKLPKTRLSLRQLREFKQLLLRKRAELMGDVERLTDGAFRRGTDGQAELSSMPIHMADIGSDNWEQDFTLGLIANEQSRIRDIDDALRRIRNRTYGVCLATHGRITVARLRAKPWAKYCIEYARAREDGRAR